MRCSSSLRVQHSAQVPHSSSASSPNRDDTNTISRLGVALSDIEKAPSQSQSWAALSDESFDLAEIQRSVHAAGLD